ncbi:MAG: transglutaminase domain-containing protein [Pirellulaceae bacterium]
MFLIQSMFVTCLLTFFPGEIPRADQPSDDNLKSRAFELSSCGKIDGLTEGLTLKIWIPVPSESAHQNVELIAMNFPARVQFTREPEYGNRMIYCETVVDASGNFQFEATFRVKRFEDKWTQNDPVTEIAESRRLRLLKPDRLVPITGSPLDSLLANRDLAQSDVEKVRDLYDIVLEHMTYDKSKPGYGNGDVLWACDSRTGNCTDFHSLFISLCRRQKIPAVFEIGFPLPDSTKSGVISGYHCWAKCFVEGKGWLAVDISEADKHPEMTDYFFGNLTPDRVALSQGRDIVLEPAQAGEPLNSFVKPCAEVDGVAIDTQQLNATVTFQDVDTK